MKRKLIDGVISFYSWLCVLAIAGAMTAILGYLVANGFHTLGKELIFGEANPIAAILLRQPVFDGLFPAIVGTLTLILLSVLLAIPLGILAGIYLAEFSRGPVKQFFNLLFDIQAGIPSILIGLFGFSVAVFLHRVFEGSIYPCLLISACSLAFLVLPYIIRTTQVSLETLPDSIRLTAPALGATKLQNILYVLLPRSMNGIVSGIVLSIGRCAEDTAVIMLTGVVATAGIPKSLFGSYEALPFYIYYISSQYSDQQELQKGFGAALILLALCGMLLALALLIKKRFRSSDFSIL